jgi:hypothetical protein
MSSDSLGRWIHYFIRKVNIEKIVIVVLYHKNCKGSLAPATS